MTISWKELDKLHKKNHDDYLNGEKTTFTWAEVTRLLYMARKYKELLKEMKKGK